MAAWTREKEWSNPKRYMYWLHEQEPGALSIYPRKVWGTWGKRDIGGLDRIACKRSKRHGWEVVFYGWGGPTFMVVKTRTLSEAKDSALRWLSGEEV